MKKRIFKITGGLLIGLLLIFLLFNSSPRVTPEDKKFLLTFLKDWKIELVNEQIHQNQQTEIDFISKIQDSVMATISHNTIPFDSAGNVHCYYTNRKGLCFDRALLLEKFCQLAGFQIRHIYIYFNNKGELPTRSDFFNVGLTSHAMFEVKTKKGWMAVGTNSNWLAEDKSGSPLTLGEIRKRLTDNTLQIRKDATFGIPFFRKLKKADAFRFVYGVYSRHGQFLQSDPVEPALISIGMKSHIPDYNIGMLFSNF